jgi:hypothetical protein
VVANVATAAAAASARWSHDIVPPPSRGAGSFPATGTSERVLLGQQPGTVIDEP